MATITPIEEAKKIRGLKDASAAQLYDAVVRARRYYSWDRIMLVLSVVQTQEKSNCQSE